MSADVSAGVHRSAIAGGLRRAALGMCLAVGLLAASAPAAGAATFANPTPIVIPALGNAAPYPSAINVSGLTGQITDVNVSLLNYTHTNVEDLAVVLVPPSGTNILLMDGPGGETAVSGVNITFDDAAAGFMPQTTAFASGSYKPTAYFQGDSFPAPGPLLNYCNPGPVGGGNCTLGHALNGNNPNGTWNLYVIDVDSPDAGTIAGGWSLDITSGVVAQRTLTVNKGGTGSGTVTGTGITCGADCSEAYNDARIVTLTATPAAGSTFAGWTGCDTASTNTCTMSMTANKTVTANFAPAQRTLTVSKSGTGGGTVTGTGIACGADCSEAYNDAGSVTLTATAAAGSTFAGWTGCDAPAGSTCTMTMTANKTVTAAFSANPVEPDPIPISPPPAPPPPPISPPPPPPALDTISPLLTALSTSPASFRAASSGPSVATNGGTRVSFRLSEDAAVSFRVERVVRGRRVGGRCVRAEASNRRAASCTRYVTRSSGFTHRGKAGANSLRFSGRLGGSKLAVGRYRLRVVATDAAGNKSGAKRAAFRIVRR